MWSGHALAIVMIAGPQIITAILLDTSPDAQTPWPSLPA
jgi:hypothetical protein